MPAGDRHMTNLLNTSARHACTEEGVSLVATWRGRDWPYKLPREEEKGLLGISPGKEEA